MPIKDRIARDKLVKDYLETRDRVKQKFVNEQLGQLDYQEDAKKIFKPIIDSQDKTATEIQKTQKDIKETIIQEMPKALTYSINKALPSTEIPAIDSAISLSSVSKTGSNQERTKQAVEFFMNNVDKNLNLDTIAKYNFPAVSELINDPNNPNLGQMANILNSKNQKGSLTHEKSKLTRKIHDTSNDEYRTKLNEEYKDLEAYGKQVTNAYKFFNKIKTGKGIDYFILSRSNNKSINYYHDPVQLFKRLCLLVSSQEAGNTGVNNEISEIIDELLETNVINTPVAKILYQKYLT